MSTKRKRRDKFSPLTVVMLIILVCYCVALLYMLFWGLSQTLKTPDAYDEDPAGFTKFGDMSIINYKFVYAFINHDRWNRGSGSPGLVDVLLNTGLYAIGGALLNVMVTCLVAYLTARYHYFYSKILYGIVIVVMVTPIVGAQASEIQVLRSRFINLYNTRWAFVVLKASFVGGVYFLVFHAAFKDIPATYSEAAMIDGAGNWCIMLKICFPLVTNVFMTIFLITFIQYWNDYQLAMIYMPDYPTLSTFIFSFQTSTLSSTDFMSATKFPYLQDYDGIVPLDPELTTIQLAAACVLVLPISVLFITMHKRLMGNLSVGGIKG